MELILFNKYLVRAYERGFILSKVKDGKQAIVKDGLKLSEAKGSKDKMVPFRDYSNFGKETFPSTFESVLSSIRNQEIADSNVKTIEELSQLLKDIKAVEVGIASNFK